MKLFIYKALVAFFLIFLLFQLTIGTLIHNYEEKLGRYLSKENLSHIKIKMRKEMNSGGQCFVVYPLIEESEKLDLNAAK